MIAKTVVETAAKLPKRPGVYIFRDAQGKPLYIGKARSLAKRVKDHIQRPDETPKHTEIMERATSLEAIITRSEHEALLLESNLIKYMKPKYNVRLMDGKRHPFLKLTNEKYPRILKVRRMAQDGARYFGPYTSEGTANQLRQLVRTLFGIRTCKSIDPRTCLNQQMDLCLCPSSGVDARSAYPGSVADAAAFLDGDHGEILMKLESEMEQASKALEYEKAGRLRDRLEAVRRGARLQGVQLLPGDKDFVGVAKEGRAITVALFKVRNGLVVDRSLFDIDQDLVRKWEDGTDPAYGAFVVRGFLEQYYSVHMPPPYIGTCINPSKRNELEEWLRTRAGRKVQIRRPTAGVNKSVLELAQSNADLANRQKVNALEGLKTVLHLPTLPRIIEGLDISTLHGKESVASLVVFKDGRPHKSSYRKYNIRSVEGQDDYAMLGEAIQRRYSRMLREERKMPDLVLVDGGKGQVNRARDVLKAVGARKVPVIGLAKRNELVFLPGVESPLPLARGTASLRLLQAVRDEAHRFAITAHRARRSKTLLTSELDAIPGLGPKRRRELLRYFGSVKEIKGAAERDISRVPGIGLKMASIIANHLRR